jgi:hypothetical protein
MPAIWRIPSSGLRPREVSIYRFLKDARCPVRVVEVRLFRRNPLFGRRPVYTRRWEPGSALAATAKEISKYIGDNGSVDSTIVALSDEV